MERLFLSENEYIPTLCKNIERMGAFYESIF